ncbi:hypothetical protein C8J57DRAFT_1703695 [Mycena rebaudengoi]|nr:hypothetical protein C8J57DRAFT_1703695 [Mycena rebaudengoi]
MVAKKNTSPNVPKKKKSPSKKRASAYNKFVSAEMERLKALNVEGETGRDRWKMAVKNWGVVKNANAAASTSGSSP